MVMVSMQWYLIMVSNDWEWSMMIVAAHWFRKWSDVHDRSTELRFEDARTSWPFFKHANHRMVEPPTQILMSWKGDNDKSEVCILMIVRYVFLVTVGCSYLRAEVEISAILKEIHGQGCIYADKFALLRYWYGICCPRLPRHHYGWFPIVGT